MFIRCPAWGENIFKKIIKSRFNKWTFHNESRQTRMKASKALLRGRGVWENALIGQVKWVLVGTFLPA